MVVDNPLVECSFFQIIAEMKVSPRKFKGTEGVEAKGWKARPNAQQSSLLRSIKKRMQQRKLKLKAFQNQHIFDKLFVVQQKNDSIYFIFLQKSCELFFKALELFLRSLLVKSLV